jgi:hypothetical protein
MIEPNHRYLLKICFSIEGFSHQNAIVSVLIDLVFYLVVHELGPLVMCSSSEVAS